MRTREQNIVAMGKVAVSVMEKHAEKWQANRRVSKAVADAKAVLEELEARNRGGLAQSQGTTSQKEQTADKIAELAGKITKRVKVYAIDENNLDLKQKVGFTKSDFHNMSDTDFSAQIQNLIAAVSPVVADLADYGVDKKMLDELSALAAEFKTLESQPRHIIAERKMHNASIPNLLRMLRQDLESIDGLIGIFEDKDLESEFKSARMIIDRGTIHKPGETPEKK